MSPYKHTIKRKSVQVEQNKISVKNIRKSGFSCLKGDDLMIG